MENTSEPPTPHYNSSVLGDMLPRNHLLFLTAVSSQCTAFAERVALLKYREALLSGTLTNCVCVKDGLALRIQVACHREPQVLRESVCTEGLLIVRENEETQALEMATMHRPLLTCTGSSNSTHTLGRCVAWPSAGWELFSDDITEDTADLLVVSLFLQLAPFTLQGLLRWVSFAFSSFDWRNNPRWSTSTTSSPLLTTLRSRMTSSSPEFLPVIFIATPNSHTVKDRKKKNPVCILNSIVKALKCDHFGRICIKIFCCATYICNFGAPVDLQEKLLR
ncbi:nucleolar protein 6 [Salmo salar]|uniref:Nucleolar protein 6 n=1 Tax=Salmo salar TaxID=8030 RepID=A0ABM3DN02_SALSA|nr:nucleolar protein 6-like [Salmo salar]